MERRHLGDHERNVPYSFVLFSTYELQDENACTQHVVPVPKSLRKTNREKFELPEKGNRRMGIHVDRGGVQLASGDSGAIIITASSEPTSAL